MVAPITGPFSRNVTWAWPPVFTSAGFQSSYLYRTWYRQKPPYTLPLTFTSQRCMGNWVSGSDRAPLARNVDTSLCWISTPTASSSNAYNNAWSEFNEKVRGQAEWAVTLIQYQRTFDQLVKNVNTLYQVFHAVKHGNFAYLYKRFKPPEGFKAKGKSFSSRVLEWRFGWQPLWNDIHDSAASLGRDLGDCQVTGKGRGKYTETSTYTLSGTYATIRETRTSSVDQRYRISALVRIANPNLLLWDSLGMANPALVAYELIPFSFVANYFFSLEEFCRGLVPFMGMELINAHTTHLATCKTIVQGTPVAWSYPYPKIGPYRVLFDGVIMSRSVGAISGPVLRKRDPWIVQPGRALNAVSLLLQQLAKH